MFLDYIFVQFQLAIYLPDTTNEKCKYTRSLSNKVIDDTKVIRDAVIAGYAVSSKDGKTILVQKENC